LDTTTNDTRSGFTGLVYSHILVVLMAKRTTRRANTMPKSCTVKALLHGALPQHRLEDPHACLLQSRGPNVQLSFLTRRAPVNDGNGFPDGFLM
jgi:hypothetical protein